MPCETDPLTTRLSDFNHRINQQSNTARIQLLRIARHLVLRFEGRCTGHGYHRHLAELQCLAREHRPDRLVVDLAYCEVLASPAIGLVAFTMMSFARSGGRVHLVTRNPTFLTAFRVLGLDHLCLLNSTLDEALGRDALTA